MLMSNTGDPASTSLRGREWIIDIGQLKPRFLLTWIFSCVAVKTLPENASVEIKLVALQVPDRASRL